MNVRWLRRARLNLKQVRASIAEENPRAASETVERISGAVEKLAEHPAMGRAGRVPGTRELVVSGTPCTVPYRVREGRLEVLRVLHLRRRWPKDP